MQTQYQNTQGEMPLVVMVSVGTYAVVSTLMNWLGAMPFFVDHTTTAKLIYIASGFATFFLLAHYRYGNQVPRIVGRT